jgi:DNA-binding transcriptional ArsR family regulator
MADGVVVLEPGCDRAKKIARAMASQTASDVLGILRRGERTSSEIAEALDLPITTVAYHIENLADAGMIEVVKTRWSRKGREVKVYGIPDQLVIVAPGTKDIKSLLLKYASLFGILILATVLIAGISPLLLSLDGAGQQVYAPPGEADNAFKIATVEEQTLAGRGASGIVSEYALVLAFFGGGCVILLLLIGYEIYFWYRDSRTRSGSCLQGVRPPRE